MMTTRLTIEGMTCSGCVARVEKAIRCLPGVASAKVELRLGRATVEHGAAKITPDQLREAITAAGYEAST